MNARTNRLAGISRASKLLLSIGFAAAGFAAPAFAQSPSASTTPAADAAPSAQAAAPAPEAADTAPPRRNAGATSVSQGDTQAWTMLRDAAKSSKPDTRIQAVSAFSTMAGSAEARKMIASSLADPDMDVRVAAVVAIQTAKNRSMIPALRKALDDKSPEVSFAAAVALWRMGDPAGTDLLFEVMDGERKASTGFIGSNLHTANKDMHSPSTLAAIGAKQGAYMLLGPFGVGLDAWDYIRKGGTGNSARVLAVTLLSEKRSAATRDKLVAALADKDFFVRIAAARALGDYRTKAVESALLDAFGDSKGGVRLMAAASYLRGAGYGAGLAPGHAAPGHAAPGHAAAGHAGAPAAKPAAKSAQ